MVPLMFKTRSDGNFIFNINPDNMGFDYVLLEDKKTKTFHNLLENPIYQFKGLLKDDANRFVLHFTPINESVSKDNLSALIYYDGDDLVVDLTDVPEQTEIKVFDILGRLILNKKIEGKSIQYFPMGKTKQLLLVVAKSEAKIKKCKVLIY